jgi:hypothetical protein
MRNVLLMSLAMVLLYYFLCLDFIHRLLNCFFLKYRDFSKNGLSFFLQVDMGHTYCVGPGRPSCPIGLKTAGVSLFYLKRK